MRFEIIKPIRSGATGVVYLARDTVKGNIVALKQLRPDVAFPQQEVLLAQKVTHPNVCRVHEFFVENGVAQILCARKTPAQHRPKQSCAWNRVFHHSRPHNSRIGSGWKAAFISPMLKPKSCEMFSNSPLLALRCRVSRRY